MLDKYMDIFNNITDDSHIRRLLVINILIFLILTVLVPRRFLSIANFHSMAFQLPEFGILSTAMMIAMLTGGIDLSIIANANLSGIFAAYILTGFAANQSGIIGTSFGIILAIGVALLTGIVVGLFNGFLVSKIGITPILATLGTSQLLSGIAIVITRGYGITGYPQGFILLGNGSILGIPIPFIVFIALIVVFTIILNRTTFGFKIYMIGTNSIASKFSGIDKEKIILKTYMVTGFLAAIAGIIIIARTNSAKPGYGSVYLLQAVLVSVMAGADPEGGIGKITGVILAVFSLQFLSSGFNLLRFSNFAKQFAWGVLLLVVMVSNYLLEKRKERLSYKKT